MGTGLFNYIAQACQSLAATTAPSITAMGIHIVIALATIVLVWFGVQEALASAHGGAGFSMGRFLNLFMLLTFAYAMVNYYDTSIPGLGFSIKGFIDGGTINLMNIIGADGATTMLNEIHTASSKTGPGMLNSMMSPYYAIVYFVVQFLLALLAATSITAPAHAQIIEKKSLNLDGAKKAIAAAVDYARKNNAPGGVIAVVDEGGNLMALERLDGTFAMGATISIGKARTAVLFKKPTRFFEELINKGRTAMTAVDGFTPLIGGIPIVIDGQVVGGIGVSGAASANQDEELALAGAAAFSASTKADPPSKTGSANEVSGAPMMNDRGTAV